MSGIIEEQLSALADGELPAREFALLWRRMATDPELRARWARYHLAGDALRRGLPEAVDAGFAARVAAAVAREGQDAREPWPRRFAGVAAAVAVAAVALLTLPSGESPSPDPAIVVPFTAEPAVADPSRFSNAAGFAWDRARPEVQAELDRYLLNHAEDAAPADATDDDVDGAPADDEGGR